ncbi:MAG TPA: Sec-independent protein translocase protein TatB [Methyloceanibacter sp.]|nr:Sec-independent protein translocase protein TatB [Methyloceanibacter sp.]
MFDIGWSELLVIAIVAIVVVGPKELPRLMRTFGHYAGKLRHAASDFQRQFEAAMAESEVDAVRKNIDGIRSGLDKPILDKPILDKSILDKSILDKPVMLPKQENAGPPQAAGPPAMAPVPVAPPKPKRAPAKISAKSKPAAKRRKTQAKS